MSYSIGEFSNMTGLSIDTLRYYEKEGLLKPNRHSNGRRLYSDDDISWIDFILRLKETGMPLKDIRKYAVLQANGDCTLKDRRDMLADHRCELCKNIARQQEHLLRLDDKIDYYEQAISHRINEEK